MVVAKKFRIINWMMMMKEDKSNFKLKQANNNER